MRKLKDYMKLIFTAVLCFFMNLVSGKAKGSKVKVREKSGEYGNLIAVTEKNGLRETNEACTEKDRRMADQMAGVFCRLNKIKRIWLLRTHRIFTVQPVNKPVYNNTG